MSKLKQDFKKTFSFVDKDNHRAKVDAEITHRNGYTEFTACATFLNSGGQCLDNIKPDNQWQKDFIELWEKYHLKEANQNFIDRLLLTIKNIEGAEKIRAEEKQKELEEKEEENEDAKLLNQMDEYGIDENMIDVCKAYLSNFCDNTTLEDFGESYQGEYASVTDFAQELAEELGEVDSKAHWPNNCIDWEQASRGLMMDYFEVDGFYFRSL